MTEFLFWCFIAVLFWLVVNWTMLPWWIYQHFQATGGDSPQEKVQSKSIAKAKQKIESLRLQKAQSRCRELARSIPASAISNTSHIILEASHGRATWHDNVRAFAETALNPELAARVKHSVDNGPIAARTLLENLADSLKFDDLRN